MWVYVVCMWIIVIAAIRQQHFIDQKVSKLCSLCAWLAMLLPGKPLPPFSASRRHDACVQRPECQAALQHGVFLFAATRVPASCELRYRDLQ